MTGAVRAWRWLDSKAATRIIQVVAILSLFAALFVGVRQYSLADCLSQNLTDTSNASAQRLQAAEQDRKALDNMIAAIAGARSASPAEAQAQVNGALDTYIEARRQSDEQRRRNPPPPPPSQACN
jgi:hypothetical protein